MKDLLLFLTHQTGLGDFVETAQHPRKYPWVFKPKFWAQKSLIGTLAYEKLLDSKIPFLWGFSYEKDYPFQ